jgi:alanyl-tRNA synthetase
VKKEHQTAFCGFTDLQLGGCKVLAIVSEGQLIDHLDESGSDDAVRLVLDKTPFYGEKGGQVGDTGRIAGEDFSFDVTNTQMDGDLTVHIGKLTNGKMAIGNATEAVVDHDRRQAISRAHTATHLLHYVLRRRLGAHSEQQGSKVDRDILRFDFTHHAAVDPFVLGQIETEVNELILATANVVSNEMPIEDARKSGAVMLFGEKYPEKVRVVLMDESKELCGGTHLSNTAGVGFFKIISEESVSSGVRRITALTGREAMRRILKNETILQKVALLFKTPYEEVPDRVETVLGQVKKMRKQLEVAAQAHKISVDDLIAGAEEIGETNTKVILWTLPEGDANYLRQTIDQIRRKAKSVAVMLIAPQEDDKALMFAGLSSDLCDKKLNAVDWVKAIVPLIGGAGGGGRPDLGQAGGKDATKAPDAIAAAKKWLERELT